MYGTAGHVDLVRRTMCLDAGGLGAGGLTEGATLIPSHICLDGCNRQPDPASIGLIPATYVNSPRPMRFCPRQPGLVRHGQMMVGAMCNARILATRWEPQEVATSEILSQTD